MLSVITGQRKTPLPTKFHWCNSKFWSKAHLSLHNKCQVIFLSIFWPCVVINNSIFFTNLMHKFLFIFIHLLHSSTCFEHYCAHPQEDKLPSSGVAKLATSEEGSRNDNMTYTGGCRYSLMYSWWWVWKAPVTCRVTLQWNKIDCEQLLSCWFVII